MEEIESGLEEGTAVDVFSIMTAHQLTAEREEARIRVVAVERGESHTLEYREST